MSSPLDLYSIALLTAYEAASTDPRFHSTELREIAINKPFSSALVRKEDWDDLPSPKHGYIFDQLDPPTTGPDLPGGMLPQGKVIAERVPTPQELETIYYEVRGNGGGYRSICILQHLFDSYPPTQPLLIRTSSGHSLLITIADRTILEFTLKRPKLRTFSAVAPIGHMHLTGEDPTTHAVWGFAQAGSESVSHVLDLSSMQFGEAGRGKGGEIFKLATIQEFFEGMKSIAEGSGGGSGSDRIGPSPVEAWVKEVAVTVRARWENREKAPWCAHCGKPDPPKKCVCGEAYYCSPEHSAAGWGGHKKWCSAKPGTVVKPQAAK